MKNLKKLSREKMKSVDGGIRWTQCQSTNVCDRTIWTPCVVQSAQAYAHNLIYCQKNTGLD